MNSYEKDMVEVKSDIKILQKEMGDVKLTVAKHDVQIESINRTLSKIEENTMWIKRKIMGAIITVGVSGVAGLIFAAIKGGLFG